MPLLFILLWILGTVNLSAATPHMIQVDPVNGVDIELCWTGNLNCKSLHYALKGVVFSDTTVMLFSGSINLTASNILYNLSSIIIVGSGVTATTIECGDSRVGLSFIGMTDLTIANLTISNCGMLQNSTTCNGSSQVQYPSAVTIYNSSNVTVHSVSFTHNNGIGLSIVNTGGHVNITGSTFDGNYVTDDEYPGGGGLYIEFPFCLPESFPNSLPSKNDLNSNSHYTINSCYFSSNIAKKMNPSQHFNKNLMLLPCNEQTFGHGGGMSVFFRGYSTDNTINIINTVFVNNTAVWGGGLFIEFNHHASGNKITVKDHSQFSNNNCIDNDDTEITGGGAVQIAYTPYDSHSLPNHNDITFSHCDFANNTAYWGGGVSYVIITEQHATGTNSLYFIDCHWQYNVAKFGAAIDLSLYRSLTSGVAQAVVFEKCSFVSNRAMYNIKPGQFELQGAGIVYANSIAIQTKERMEFIANSGSALVLSASYINITDKCNVMFADNNGLRGGAISLLASSWVSIGKNTAVSFVRNHADEVGGAIYAELTNKHNVISEWNCFIQYSNITVPPDDWTTTVEFQDNNSTQGGHSIYATTISSCVWGKNYMPVNETDTRNVFRHWNSFRFTGTSNIANGNEISTAPTNYTIAANATKLRMSPGEKYFLRFKQYDDEGHDAKPIFFVQSKNSTISSVDNRSIYIYSDIMQVYGRPGATVNFTLTSLGPIPSTVTLNVTFDDCPPGYIIDDNNKPNNKVSCKCGNDIPKIPGILECNDSSYQAYITRFYWAGFHKDSTGNSEVFVTSICPKGYCSDDASAYKILLPNNKSELDFCSQNRNGTICGECKDGYSISSQSNCIKCNHGIGKGILLFILYECLPTLLFVSIILIFNINITSGHWNSLIFYFQIVGNLNLYALHSPKDYHSVTRVFIAIHQNIYGIWNLEFFQTFKPWPETCYFKGMKNIFELNALRYITLLFPLGLIGVVYLFTNYCSCLVCNRLPVCIRCRELYIRFTNYWKKWFGKTFLIHGLAAFIVVSYTRLALLSMRFLISTPLYQYQNLTIDIRAFLVGTIIYFSAEHLPYVLLAIIFLLISIMLPFYLIFRRPSQMLFSKCLKEEQQERCDPPLCCCVSGRIREKIKQLFEEFYGPFKVNRRFYAGLFFIYRLAFYAILAFTPTLQIQYCVQQCLLVFILLMHSLLQPYDDSHSSANIWDALIFFNLNCINALAVYNYYSVIDIQGESRTAVAFQLIFIYLPLLLIPYHFIWWVRKTCWVRDGPNNNARVPLLLERDHRNYDEQMSSIEQHPDFDMERQRERMRAVFQQHTINLDGYDVIEERPL